MVSVSRPPAAAEPISIAVAPAASLICGSAGVCEAIWVYTVTGFQTPWSEYSAVAVTPTCWTGARSRPATWLL